MPRRVGYSERDILIAQSNLANMYHVVGRCEDSLSTRRDVYAGCLKIHGEEHRLTLTEASNCAGLLLSLNRYEESKSLLRKTMPVARRVLKESHELTLKMSWIYAEALCKDDAATLDDLREAVTTLEDTARTARRVLGGAHPTTVRNERSLRNARAILSVREVAPTCVAIFAAAALALAAAYLARKKLT